MSTQARRRCVAAAGGGDFDPESDIDWHTLFWAEGTDFVAEAYSDTDSVGTWPNETGESDATEATNQPVYDDSLAALNNQPAVTFGGSTLVKLQTSAFSSNPDYTAGVSIIAIVDKTGTGQYNGICDGIGTSNRNLIYSGVSELRPQIFAGSAVTAGADGWTGQFLVRGFFDGSTGTDTLHLNETVRCSGSAGAHTLTGVRIGNIIAGAQSLKGSMALFGIYEGDITADGSWSDFTDWAEDHYGLTIA